MRRLLKNLGAYSLGPIAVGALSFLMTALVTRVITPDEYGRTGMFQTTQGLVSTVIFLAMDQAYAREFIPTAPEKRDSLLASAMLLPLGMSAAAAAVFALFQEPLSRLLFGREGEGVIVLLMAVMFPFMILFRFCTMRFRMEERGLLYSGFSIFLKAAAFGLTMALLLGYEKSFRSVVLATILSEILAGTAAALTALRGVPLRAVRPDRESISVMLRYALPLLPATMISWIYTSSDQYMLRAISGYTELGLYTGAHKINSIISLLRACFTIFWPPVAFRWYASRKPARYFHAVMWAVSLLSTMGALGLLLCKDIAGLLLGSQFRQSIMIFPFLLLSPVMYVTSETSSLGIPFSKKTGWNIVVSSITAATNVLLNLILIPLWGGRGAAVATGLSYIAFFWGRTLISRKLWEPFPLRHFVGNTLILLVNCAAHTFLSGPAPYLISGASLVLLAIANIPNIKDAWKLLQKMDA